MKHALLWILFISGSMQVSALVISEVMSNPTGDDSGREWVELYNDATSSADLSTLTISIKGGTAMSVTPLGSASLPAGGYAIIGSTVSGATKFLQDYPTYSGPLFKSAISLVNTGSTSIDIKINGTIINSLPSYTAAKEGSSLSLIAGSFILGIPTPGADNQADTGGGGSSQTTTATTSNNQATIPQMSPPSSDIVLYVPFEKTVVAGADTLFEAYALTHAGGVINGLTCKWAFGDGGQGTGSTTTYKYAYTGKYVTQVEGTNGSVAGIARMLVRVVSPEISIVSVGSGKYGNYIDVINPNAYDLNLSQWRLVINGQGFPFPKHTTLAGNTTTRLSGLAMGFASTTISASTTIKIVFPNQEEVTSYSVPETSQNVFSTSTISVLATSSNRVLTKPTVLFNKKIIVATSTVATTQSKKVISNRDTRIISWVQGLFGK